MREIGWCRTLNPLARSEESTDSDADQRRQSLTLKRILRAGQAGSVGWQQGEPFSLAQVPGCDNEEVAAV
jgi:hypothetical protein